MTDEELVEAFDRVLFAEDPPVGVALFHPDDFRHYLHGLPSTRRQGAKGHWRVLPPTGPRSRAIRTSLHTARGTVRIGPEIGEKKPYEAYSPAPVRMSTLEFYRRALAYLTSVGSKGNIYLHPEDAKIFIAFSGADFASEVGVSGYDGRLGELSGPWESSRAIYALSWVAKGTVLAGFGGGSMLAEIYPRTSTLTS